MVKSQNPCTADSFENARRIPAGGGGRPTLFVTTTDGSSEAALWSFGAGGGSGLFKAFDDDTGALLYQSPSQIPGVFEFHTGIVANGKVYIAGQSNIYRLKF